MKVVGVTGCVGAGKSTVCRALAEAGWAVFDVDDEAAALVPLHVGALREVLGPDALLHPSAVLAAMLLRPEKRPAIEAILLPALTARLTAWKAALTSPGVIDAALLFEGGLDAWCDATLCVTCDASIRRSRVEQRSTTSAHLFDAIEAAQWTEAEKARRATVVMSSNADEATLRAAVLTALQRL